MSGADYEYCPVCDMKALYVGEDDMPENVIVLHAACLEQEREAVADLAVKDERARIRAGAALTSMNQERAALPDAAITAAVRAVDEHYRKDHGLGGFAADYTCDIEAALEAAAPALRAQGAAAEREACAQLAIDHDAVYTQCGNPNCVRDHTEPFADLIRARSQETRDGN